MYVLREEEPTRWGLGLARLSFAAAAIVVGVLVVGGLTHLGERQSSDWFFLAFTTGVAWWGMHRVVGWIARGFFRA